MPLQDKFKVCVKSILEYATRDLNVFIIGDNESQKIAKSYFNELKNVKIKYDVSRNTWQLIDWLI